MKRCGWVKESNPLYVAYHDQEWGRVVKEDQPLFELLCLESYQAGLSWETILNKRLAFRQVFYEYDVEKVARMTDRELDKLLENSAIIRHRAKIFATRQNAQAFLEVQKEYGTFAEYLWSWVNFTQIDNLVKDYRQVPSRTTLSEQLSKDLKKRGFTFVGPVCIYSYMQAAGLVNDHEVACFVH
ncbi:MULTISPECIES: DNA-3-methyladenine glycosylase I [unclassified Streptococcus]|uniref:DNA-3-methyladenine glycosylase I n=1 Tax=unclassified Streptococcus TaxID=2608887 RepID=UPI0010725768|nr:MULTISPECIES: DNA-3-methyladenine glycosylase I [unclassified Streptococcus]MBF0787544.1 DNA-3-methyladenine glycosylase I [Streptococcus sp. 19428wC2_LYSM12]MCQ9211431.1 DNA-3-methyladenine glycosylase I [Streptococcus sp. B01]MCQ9214745.1 DNA-3-methyladenine glycosylase I [Streptococcus sp. O1]TFV05494.1 DNA-3-methyladenine glycosylase I [Streptococcus sp. LYSM12]